MTTSHNMVEAHKQYWTKAQMKNYKIRWNYSMLNSKVKRVVTPEDQAVKGKEIRQGFWRAGHVLFLDRGTGLAGVLSLQKFFTLMWRFIIQQKLFFTSHKSPAFLESN